MMKLASTKNSPSPGIVNNQTDVGSGHDSFIGRLSYIDLSMQMCHSADYCAGKVTKSEHSALSAISFISKHPGSRSQQSC